MVHRTVRWVPAASKAYERFPVEVRDEIDDAINDLRNGGTPNKAKPLQGFSGVLEIAIKHRTDAWRVVYALKIGEEIWMIHAFQKKSKSGIATPKAEIDTIRKRLKHLTMMMS